MRVVLCKIFSKELFTQHPYVIGYIIIVNTLVGLAVGAIGGASGINGLFNLTGSFDASPQIVLTSATFSLHLRAGALDKLKQKSVWHVPSGRANPDVTNRLKSN